MVPSATHQAADGKYVVIGGNGDSIYTRLMAAIGRPDMGSDNPKYANNTLRCEEEAEINQVDMPCCPCAFALEVHGQGKLDL